MKQIKRITIAFTILMSASLCVFFSIGSRFGTTDRDMSYYNDLLYRICEDYSAGVPEDKIEQRYNCNIILSKKLEDPELSKLYASGALVLDLSVNGEYIGKAAWNDTMDKHKEARRSFTVYCLSLWGLILILGYLLLYIVYLDILKPVGKLNDFSAQIAKGNLDVPLPIRKHNIFDGFTETFDIMRIELRESRRREIDSEMARKELVTKLSHDIKTPAAVIKATCEVLQLKFRRSADAGTSGDKAGGDIKDTLEKLDVISDKADTISSLMGNVMHSTINDLEEPEVNTVEEDSRIIEEYFKKLRDYGNIILDNNIPPCLVYMDRLRMEQVIDNIIGNSYKYAGTDIHVSFGELTDMLMADGTKGRFIKITVRDFGPGADEDELPLLSEKYYRGSNAAEGNGYGLGLYNVKWYMNKQGGGMDYYNDSGFVVELLLKKV